MSIAGDPIALSSLAATAAADTGTKRPPKTRRSSALSDYSQPPEAR